MLPRKKLEAITQMALRKYLAGLQGLKPLIFTALNVAAKSRDIGSARGNGL
jgi:hypothetical protein